MNIVLLGKFLVAGGTIAVPAVGYVLWDKYFNNDQGSYVYVVVESGDGSSDVAATSNFKCKLEGLTTKPAPFKCKVEHLDLSSLDTKKHLDFSDFDGKLASGEIAPDKLKVANSVYKLTIDETIYAEIKNTDKKIEIMASSNGNEKYVNAKLLFAVDKSGKIFDGKAEYFVAKAPTPETSLANLTGSDTYQCAWEKSPANQFKDCEIYDFAATDVSSNGYSSLIFQKPESTNKSTAIVENKHYLIKFTEKKDPKELNLDKKQIVFIKKGVDLQTTSVEFKNIQPSFLIDDKLLILGSQSQ